MVSIKKLFGSKRGSESELWAADTILFWVLYGVAVGFAAIYFVLTVYHIGSQQAIVHQDLEEFFLAQRFSKSPYCFSYYKDGVALPDLIDSDKFNQQRIESCYGVNDGKIPAFRLTLKTKEPWQETIKTKNWNDNIGPGQGIAPKSVAVYKNFRVHNGELSIEVQNPQ